MSDDELLTSLGLAAERSRRSCAELVANLAEVDARKLFLRRACSSMHEYCVKRLGLSDDAAAKRIQVARLARRLPVVLEHLAAGRIHLTGLRLLAPHLGEANSDELLGRALGKGKREIEKLVAEVAPRPDVLPRMRKLKLAGPVQAQVESCKPGRVLPPEPSTQLAAKSDGGERSNSHAPGHVALTLQPPQARARVEPLSPRRYRVEFTAGEKLVAKIDKAKELLRHRLPDGDLEEVIDRAMTLLCEKLEKERFGRTKRPRQNGHQAKTGSRRIPNAVKRAVAERDGEQCTYVDDEGRRCTATAFLEYDHVVPFARGGKSTESNLRLRCRGHNSLHADQCFGAARMARHRHRASPPGTMDLFGLPVTDGGKNAGAP